MLTALRQQVNAVLAGLQTQRRAALRRSDAPDALLATDLPHAADAAETDAFIARLTALGWRVWPGAKGWLLLDAPVPVPDVPEEKDAAGECGCCLTILARHPDSGDAEDWVRAVVKAAEAGRQPFERLCTRLHGELATRLRRHEPLPGALLPYLRRACQDLYAGREGI